MSSPHLEVVRDETELDLEAFRNALIVAGKAAAEHRPQPPRGFPRVATDVPYYDDPGFVTRPIRARPGSSSIFQILTTAIDTPLIVFRANPRRLGFLIVNRSQTGTLYLTYGPEGNSNGCSVPILPNGEWDDPFEWIGDVSAAWSDATGSAFCTELFPPDYAKP